MKFIVAEKQYKTNKLTLEQAVLRVHILNWSGSPDYWHYLEHDGSTFDFHYEDSMGIAEQYNDDVKKTIYVYKITDGFRDEKEVLIIDFLNHKDYKQLTTHKKALVLYHTFKGKNYRDGGETGIIKLHKNKYLDGEFIAHNGSYYSAYDVYEEVEFYDNNLEDYEDKFDTYMEAMQKGLLEHAFIDPSSTWSKNEAIKIFERFFPIGHRTNILESTFNRIPIKDLVGGDTMYTKYKNFYIREIE